MASLLSLNSISLLQPSLSSPKMTIRNITPKLKKIRASSYDLKQGQSRLFHQLPSGLKMEVIEQKRGDFAGKLNTQLWFLFMEVTMPLGAGLRTGCLSFLLLDSIVMLLACQGESDEPPGTVAGSLQTHAGDIADFIKRKFSSPPVLVGHSFGGLIIQFYISDLSNNRSSGSNVYPKLAGAALVCSVPPSGNSGLVWRYLFTKPIAAFKVTRSLAAKGFQTSLSLCRETFFSSTMEDHLVKRYQELMIESSRLPLFDLRKLNASLPVAKIPESSIKLLVLGAKDDFIVDTEGLNETSRFYGVSPVCVEGVAHDMMLDCSWDKGANILLSWLNEFNKI